jgi:adenosylcobinamide-GDP ribazoletransferase
VLAAAIARWLVLLAARQPGARPGGLGAAFSSGLRPAALWLAGVLPLGLALLGSLRGLAALAAAHLVAWVIFRIAAARVGGLTGDVFGLTVELSELSVLLVYAASSL